MGRGRNRARRLSPDLDTSPTRLNLGDRRRYSNMMDLPGVSTPWVDSKDFTQQEQRFFNDFRPFFLLCQLSGMFPYKLNWQLSFGWCYWATALSLLLLIVLVFLLMFYIVQVVMVVSVKAGLLYIAYNLAWVVHIAHSIDWILTFFHDRKLFAEIFQGYRKFYRYLLADKSDKSVIKFTWKTFVAWEIMFYITAAALVLKSYYDRFLKETDAPQESLAVTEEERLTCAKIGIAITDTSNRTILATVDQLEIVQEYFSEDFRNVLFWVHLIANIICINVVFLSEVFFMFMISIIYHAFNFIHKQLDVLLGNPDSIFNISVVHEPVDIESEADKIVKKEMKKSRGLRLISPQRPPSGRQDQVGISRNLSI